MSAFSPRGMILCVLAVVGLMATNVSAASPAENHDFLDARHFQIGPARHLIANGSTGRQILDCWQITQGSWSGEVLSGISVALVQEISEDGTTTRQTVYISELATEAQRQAVLTALAATYPDLFPHRDSTGLRVEPAVIQLEEIGGQGFVLHIGLIG